MAAAAEPNHSPTKEERRKRVYLGELPADFLRLGGGQETASASADLSEAARQIAADEQAARALQQQLVAPAPPPLAYGAPVVYTGFVPPNTRGRLSVTVVEAKLTRNYGMMRMDPYCRLRVGNTVFETPTCHSGGKMPKWNRTVHCYLPLGIETMFVELFDERAFTTDERVAWAHVGLPEAVFNCETVDDWYSLTGQQGEGKEGMVNLILSFAPLDAAQPLHYVPQPPQAYVLPTAVQPAVPAGGAPQPPQGPLYSEADVKELQEMFPAIEGDVIRCVLDEKRGNKDAAVNGLLSMTD